MHLAGSACHACPGSNRCTVLLLRHQSILASTGPRLLATCDQSAPPHAQVFVADFKAPAPSTQAAFFFFATEMMNPCMWSTDTDVVQVPYTPGNGARTAACEGCAVNAFSLSAARRSGAIAALPPTAAPCFHCMPLALPCNRVLHPCANRCTGGLQKPLTRSPTPATRGPTLLLPGPA